MPSYLTNCKDQHPHDLGLDLVLTFRDAGADSACAPEKGQLLCRDRCRFHESLLVQRPRQTHLLCSYRISRYHL